MTVLRHSDHCRKTGIVNPTTVYERAVANACVVPRALMFLWIVLAVFVVVGLVLPKTIHAADEVVQFDNPAHKEMYQGLLREYRCLKCQNQNLWDSNASLAGDLRREIREQIVAGNSKAEIDQFLVARYGEFVLYRPRFTAKTAILWIGPFVLLLIGLASLVLMVRNRSRLAEKAVASEQRAEVAAELHSADSLAKARELLKD
ncbi:MAG: cytochrome c-type biogenesis protein CcmH [Granulosicoccus sp.]